MKIFHLEVYWEIFYGVECPWSKDNGLFQPGCIMSGCSRLRKKYNLINRSQIVTIAFQCYKWLHSMKIFHLEVYWKIFYGVECPWSKDNGLFQAVLHYVRLQQAEKKVQPYEQVSDCNHCISVLQITSLHENLSFGGVLKDILWGGMSLKHKPCGIFKDVLHYLSLCWEKSAVMSVAHNS